MAQEGVGVQIGAPVVLHIAVEVTYIVALFGGNLVLVGRLYRHSGAVGGGEPRNLILCVGINLYEVASGEGFSLVIGRFHLGDIYAVLVYFYLVAQLIAAFVLTIHNDVDSGAVRGVRHLKDTTQVEGYKVTHECLVAVVVYECPFLGFGWGVEDVLLAVELYAVGTFWESTREVAALTCSASLCYDVISFVAYDRYY